MPAERADLGPRSGSLQDGPNDTGELLPREYSVAVKTCASAEMLAMGKYRAGNARPIKQSATHFDSPMLAKRAGKLADDELLAKLFS